MSENRFISDSVIAIGHEDADLSLIQSGHVAELTIDILVGTPQIVDIEYADMIGVDDCFGEGKSSETEDILYGSTIVFLNVIVPICSYFDDLTFYDEISNIDHYCGFSDTLHVNDSLIAYFSWLREYIDHLTFSYDQSGADIQNELSGYGDLLNFSDSGIEHAATTYFDSIYFSPDDVISDITKGIFDTLHFHDYLQDLYIFSSDHLNAFDIVNKEATPIEKDDTLGSSDEITFIVIFDDSISGTDYYEDVCFTKGITETLHSSDTIEWGGQFFREFSEHQLYFIDFALPDIKLEFSETTHEFDELSNLVMFNDSISVSDEMVSDIMRTVSDHLTSSDYIFAGGEIEVEVTTEMHLIDIVEKEKFADIIAILYASDILDKTIFLYDVIYPYDETIYVDIRKGYYDSLEASDSRTAAGSMTVDYFDSIHLSDIANKHDAINISDSIAVLDGIDRIKEYSDVIYTRDDSVTNTLTRNCYDSLRIHDTFAPAGSMTVSYYDTSILIYDYYGVGAFVRVYDCLTIDDGFSKIASYTDTLSFSESLETNYARLVSFSDSINFSTALDFGGEFLLIQSDSLTGGDIYRQGLYSNLSANLSITDIAKRDIVVDCDVDYTLNDIISCDYPYDVDDSIYMADIYGYYELRWEKLFHDELEWAVISYPITLFSDAFEVTKPHVTEVNLFGDTLEWFNPYQIILWEKKFVEDFEISARNWGLLFRDSVEYLPLIVWEIKLIDIFEWFTPYQVYNLTTLYFEDTFEYEIIPIITIIFEDAIEWSDVTWVETPIYVYEYPINPVVWATIPKYLYEDPINPSVWHSASLFTNSFEVSYSVHWDKKASFDFEIVSPGVWDVTVWFKDTIDWVPAFDWSLIFNDDLEPLYIFRTQILTGGEKTNKRLQANAKGDYGNLVQYPWMEEDPLPYNLIIFNIVTIPYYNVCLNTRIIAQKMVIKVLPVEISSAHGFFALGYTSYISAFGEIRNKIHTHIIYTKYLYKYLTTNVPIALRDSMKLSTLITATEKERTTKIIASNLSVGRYEFKLWHTNITLATNVDTQYFNVGILSYKEVNRIFRNNIYTAYLFGLGLSIFREVNIETSYSGFTEIMYTDLTFPTKETFTRYHTNTCSAWGMVKYRNSNVYASNGGIELGRLNIYARDGEAVQRLTTSINLVRVNENRKLHVSISASYVGLSKPVIKTVIGGYEDLTFYKEVAVRLTTNIKVYGEYFGQYAPYNNRRRTNIVAGADLNHPFIVIDTWYTYVNVVKEINAKMYATIISDYNIEHPIICFTTIYAVRCSTCMKNNIVTSYKNYLDSTIWTAYGMGSADYVDKKYHLNLRALRVPQGYYITNIVLGSNEKIQKEGKTNIYAWFGPTHITKQRIWNVSLVMQKLIVTKLHTRISVGVVTTKVQTVSNIWGQKGEYLYLKTLINAPMAVKVAHYNTHILATFTANISLSSNIWVGLPDQERIVYGKNLKGCDINIQALKDMKVVSYHSNIHTIGEMLHFVSCGVHKITPPLVTELYGAKVMFVPGFYTTFDLVAILSKGTLTDSSYSLTETYEPFDIFNLHIIKHTVYVTEKFNIWIGFRFAISTGFIENYDNTPKPTYLFYKKTINSMDAEPKPVYTHTVVYSLDLEDKCYKIESGVVEDFNTAFITSSYTNSNNVRLLDVAIDEVLTIQDGYRANLVVLYELIHIQDIVRRI